MDRREFLRTLGFGTVAAAAAAHGLIDIERLLWVPGEKTIVLPPHPVVPAVFLAKGDIFTIEGRYAVNPLTRAALGGLQQFIVTADCSSDGTIATIAQFHPPIITDGIYANATAKPARTAKINTYPWSRERKDARFRS